MKSTLLVASLLLIAGCAHHSPYDITPEQAKTVGDRRMGALAKPDFKHLPPGAVKHDHVFKAGETLPDGRTAKGGEHIVTVDVDSDGKGPGGNQRRMMISDSGGAP